jgi:hypothetical protein
MRHSRAQLAGVDIVRYSTPGLWVLTLLIVCLGVGIAVERYEKNLPPSRMLGWLVDFKVTQARNPSGTLASGAGGAARRYLPPGIVAVAALASKPGKILSRQVSWRQVGDNYNGRS